MAKFKGYWKDWNNVKRELEGVVEELGHFPTRRELEKSGMSSLGRVIIDHGGFHKVRKRLGYEEGSEKPKGYWQDFDNLKKELELVIEEMGHFPTERELISMGRYDLIGGIKKFDGGTTKVREEMVYAQIRKPREYWQDFDNLKKELELVIEELGYLPVRKELVDMGRGDIVSAIHRQGGFSAVRKRLGQNQNRKPNGYWQDKNNVIKELNEIIERLGHFPTKTELRELNRSDLEKGVTLHNGLAEFRMVLGHVSIRRSHGYWKDLENIETELKHIIEELGHFPTQRELVEIGKGSLVRGISKYHSGLNVVRGKMGYGSPQIKSKDQFLQFLQQDETARNLAIAATTMNGEAYDIEKIIEDLYSDRFGNLRQVHSLLQDNYEEIHKLLEEGVTNLGYYLGGYELGDRSIIPVLLGNVITTLPEDAITPSLEERLVRLLRNEYGPRFNDNPESTIQEVKEKVNSSSGKKQEIYQKLYEHYQEVLKLEKELCHN